jgi:hypothetical protein
MNSSPILAASYRRPVFTAVVVQVVSGVLSLLLLDGGTFARVTGIAVLAFWVGVAFVVCRRPMNPTPTDLQLIRIGFIPVLFLAWLLTNVIWNSGWVLKLHGL